MTRAASYIQPDLLDEPRFDGWPFAPLEPQAYDLIMIDPPWHFTLRSIKGEGKSAQAHYATMTLDDILALPVGDLAREHCWLWLWCTAPMLPKQLACLEAWGFEYVTQVAWRKVTVNGKPAMGPGYVSRSLHEPVVIAKRGEPQIGRALPSLFDGVRREHSRKPDEAYQVAERFCPVARRADVFARERRTGWDVFGDEVGKFGAADGQEG